MATDRVARLVEAYDRRAAERDGWEPEPWKLEVADAFLARLPAEPRILDVGAGTGVFAARFAAAGADVTAVDLSPAHVALCRAKGVHARVADFCADELGDTEFDGAWAMNALLHAPPADLSAAIANIGRALVPGGLALLCQWGGVAHAGPMPDDTYDPPRFFSLLTDEEWAALPTPGLDRVETWTRPERGGDRRHHPQLMLLRRQLPNIRPPTAAG